MTVLNLVIKIKGNYLNYKNTGTKDTRKRILTLAIYSYRTQNYACLGTRGCLKSQTLENAMYNICTTLSSAQGTEQSSHLHNSATKVKTPPCSCLIITGTTLFWPPMGLFPQL